MSDDRLAVFHRSEVDARADATLRDWQAHELPVDVIAFLPAHADVLSRTLGREHVEHAFAIDPDAAQASAVACGSLLAAARHALSSRTGAACSLVDTRGGPFDALAFVAAWFSARSVKMAFLDWCDDIGAAESPASLEGVERLNDLVVHSSRPEFDSQLDLVHKALEEMEGAGVELLLYRTGAQQASLSAQERVRRDRHVWEQTARRGIAVAWNPICDASAEAATSCRQSAASLCTTLTNNSRRQYLHHARKQRTLSEEGR